MSKHDPHPDCRIALTLSPEDLMRMQSLTRGVRSVAQSHPEILLDDFYPYSLLWDGSYRDVRRSHRYQGQIAGVNRTVIERMRRVRIPLVMVENASLLLNRPWVGPDYARIARQAVQHFLQRQYRRLLFFHSEDPFQPESGLMRDAALREAGRAAEIDWFSRGPRMEKSERFHTKDQIGDLAERLSRMPPPVGVFACDDLHAWRALMACEQAGLSVPHQVGILGVGNNTFLCESTRPALSSVAIQYERIGATAMTLLLDWLRDGTQPPLRTWMQASFLEVRESTAVVRPGDSPVNRAVDHMRDHLHEPLDLDGIAQAIGTSRRSLIRHFKRDLDRTPGEVLRSLRIETAVHQLKSTNTPIAAIAAECGFSDQSHLTKRIKDVMGATPLELRRR